MHSSQFFNYPFNTFYLFSNIQQYHQQLLSVSTTCAATVNRYLAAIEEKKHLNAFVEVFATEALEQATALDEKRKSGS